MPGWCYGARRGAGRGGEERGPKSNEWMDREIQKILCRQAENVCLMQSQPQSPLLTPRSRSPSRRPMQVITTSFVCGCNPAYVHCCMRKQRSILSCGTGRGTLATPRFGPSSSRRAATNTRYLQDHNQMHVCACSNARGYSRVLQANASRHNSSNVRLPT